MSTALYRCRNGHYSERDKRGSCGECRRAVVRRQRAADPEKNRERVRAWRLANPEKARAAFRRYRTRHREQFRAYNRKYRAADPGRAREQVRRWRAANPGKDGEYARKWRAANPERSREFSRKRYARLAGASTIPFTADQLGARMAYWGYRCWMCGGPFEQVDHVKPLSKGGPHMLANLRPACGSCNAAKCDRWPISL